MSGAIPKDWSARIATPEELRPYWPRTIATELRVAVQALLAQQYDTWPMLREAVAALAEVETRELDVRGSRVVAQFNPARMVSTGARVDAASIQQRPCFLCPDNLPAEEKGIPFGDDFVVLCNPFPVLPGHLVISSRAHEPQAIEARIDAFLALTASLGEGWFTVYNGPRCGASAPDHLHFQACAAEPLPILGELDAWPRTALASEPVEAFALRDYRLNLLVARSEDAGALAAWFRRALAALRADADAAEEPMLNLIATFAAGRWTLVCYPREKHRPACYDADEPARLTVSPASIDLSGALVVPHPAHFRRITAADVETIYAEVTLAPRRFAALLERLRNEAE